VRQLPHPAVSQVDADTVARFSDGNARIALALASTVDKSESLAGLNDEALFLRLFDQRHQHDSALLSIAEVLSLVYSFDGESVAAQHAELRILSDLAGASWEQVYRAVTDLRNRGLVQARSQWRAVLPPAIANRLAIGSYGRVVSRS
jgi:hypothetical protein